MRGVYTDVGVGLVVVGCVAGSHWKAHPAWGAFLGSVAGNLLAYFTKQAAYA